MKKPQNVNFNAKKLFFNIFIKGLVNSFFVFSLFYYFFLLSIYSIFALMVHQHLQFQSVFVLQLFKIYLSIWLFHQFHRAHFILKVDPHLRCYFFYQNQPTIPYFIWINQPNIFLRIFYLKFVMNLLCIFSYCQ